MQEKPPKFNMLSGKQFVKLLRKTGMPLSTFAYQSGLNYQKIKDIEDKNQVPGRVLNAYKKLKNGIK
jgi:hypothetical protein